MVDLSMPAVGRSGELATASAVLHRVHDGLPGILLVEGEPGIGKSHLLQQLISGIPSPCTIATAKADDLTQRWPFGLISDALRSVRDLHEAARAVLDMIDTADAPGPADRSDRAIVAGLLDVVAAHLPRPLVLVLEDIHWADPASLFALRMLARRVQHGPFALIMSRRRYPSSPEVAHAVAGLLADGATQLVLGPLPDDNVAELARSVLGRPVGTVAVDRLAAAGGNPLYVRELAAAMHAAGVLEPDEGGILQLTDAAGIPGSLQALVLRRLQGLDPVARSLVRAAAAFSTTVPILVLAAAMDMSANVAADGVQQALDAAILADNGPLVSFRHDIVRESVYRATPEPVRVALHHQIGHRLAAVDGRPSDVAFHLRRAGDPAAAAWARRAATAVLPRSPAMAARHLRFVVDHDDHADSTVLAELAVAELWSGDFEAAEDAARKALALSDDSDLTGPQARATYVLGRVLVYRGAVRESLQRVTQALDGGYGDETARARLWADRALRHGLIGELAAADEATDEALRMTVDRPDAVAQLTARCAQVWNRGLRGESAAAELAMTRLGALGSVSGQEPVQPVQGRLYEAAGSLFLGLLGPAADAAADALARAEDLGTAWARPLAATVRAVTAWLTGRWDDALGDVATARAAVAAGGPITWLPLGCAAESLLLTSRGDGEGAERALTDALAMMDPGEPHIARGLVGWGDAARRTSRGDHEGALARLEQAWRDDADYGIAANLMLYGPELVREALSLGRRDLAGEVADQVVDLATRQPRARCVRSHVCGLMDGRPELIADAAQLAEKAGVPWLAARASEDAAFAYVDAGERAAASPHIERAMSFAEQLGADADLNRFRAGMRGRGIRRSRRGTASNGTQLTAAQQRVADLVAVGLSNPEIADALFISRRTVESHVSTSLAKLGLSSRVELAVHVSVAGDAG